MQVEQAHPFFVFYCAALSSLDLKLHHSPVVSFLTGVKLNKINLNRQGEFPDKKLEILQSVLSLQL